MEQNGTSWCDHGATRYGIESIDVAYRHSLDGIQEYLATSYELPDSGYETSVVLWRYGPNGLPTVYRGDAFTSGGSGAKTLALPAAMPYGRGSPAGVVINYEVAYSSITLRGSAYSPRG